MAYFKLPDGRVVAGGVSRSMEKIPLGGGEFATLTPLESQKPFTWEEKQDWVIWTDFRTRETGKTLLSECHELNLEAHAGICANCDSLFAPHEVGDYFCVYCRHEGSDFRGVPVTYGSQL